ncbi:MAG: protein kinase [Acidimicrobiia bacterium]|nr:protein kinase [Acidimicrobiia bacterium]
MVGTRARQHIGGYRVIAPIGVGGSATVYRALDEATGDEVAIKVLADNHSLVPEMRRRFLDEVELLSAVDNRSVARIYELGETDRGQPFMVLELADRGDLRERVAELRQPGWSSQPADLLVLARHLAEGLGALHEAGIVHRDVSPGNVLIRRGSGAQHPAGVTILEDGEGFLLADLGLAKDLDFASGLTAGGGTRGFAAPEQRDEVTVVDHRADIFGATALIEWTAAGSDSAGTLSSFLEVGLALGPADRFQSMEDWLAALTRCIGLGDGGGDRAVPARWWRRLTAQASSVPVGAVGAAALVAVAWGTMTLRGSADTDLAVPSATIAAIESDEPAGDVISGPSDDAISRPGREQIARSDGADRPLSSNAPTSSSMPAPSPRSAGPSVTTGSDAPEPERATTSTGSASSPTAGTDGPTTAAGPTTSSIPTSSASTSTSEPRLTTTSSSAAGSPRAYIDSPLDATVVSGDLVITGVAGHEGGISEVELVVKNLDENTHWHDSTRAFQPDWIRFPVAVSQSGGQKVTWSYTIPEASVPPGRYRLRVWARATDGTGDPVSDLIEITVS